MSAAVAGVLLVGAVVYVRTASFRGFVQHEIETTMAEILGRDVSLNLVELQPFTLRARVEALRIAGSEPGATPFVAADELRIDLPWNVVTGSRTVTDLVVRGLRVDLTQLPRTGGTAPAAAEPASFENVLDLAVVQHLDVADGWLHAGSEVVALDLVADGVGLRAVRPGADSGYAGHLEVQRGTVRARGLERTPFRLDTGFDLAADGLTLEDLTLDSDPVQVRGDVRLDKLDPLAYGGEIEAEIRPEALALEDASALPHGTIHVTGLLSGGERSLRADLRVRSESLTTGRVVVHDLTGHVVADPDGTRIDDLSFDAAGVQFAGEARAGTAFELAPFRGSLHFETSDPRKLAALVSGELALDGGLEGDVRFEAPSFDPRALRADLDVRARDVTLDGAPDLSLSADVRAGLSDGTLSLAPSRLDLPGASVSFEGKAAWDRPEDLSVRLDAGDLGRVARAVAQLRDALGLAFPAAAALEGLDGALDATARVRLPPLGAFDAAGIEGDVRIDSDRVALGSGGPFSVHAAATAAGGLVDLSRWEVTGPGLRWVTRGSIGAHAFRDLETELSASALETAVPAALPVFRALAGEVAVPELAADLRGSFDATARLDGTWTEPTGRVELTATGLATGERSVGDLSGHADLVAGRAAIELVLDREGATVRVETSVDPGDLGAGGSAHVVVEDQPLAPLLALAGTSLSVPVACRVAGRGDVTWPDLDGQVHLTLRGDAVPEEESHAITFDADGVLSIDGRVSGSFANPKATADLLLRGLEIGGRPVPDLAGPVTVDETLAVADLRSPGGETTIDVRMPFDGGGPWTVNAAYPLDLDLTGFLRGPDDPPAEYPATLATRIDAELTMAAGDFGTLAGHVRLADFRLALEGRTLRIEGTPELRIAQGRATLEPFTLRGPETVLTLSGDVAPADPWSAGLEANGTIGLALAAALSPGLRVGGTAQLHARAQAKPDEVDLSGEVVIEGGRVQQGSLPGIDDVQATLDLDHGTVRLKSLSGRIGGGPVTAEGWFDADGEDAGTFAFDASGEKVRILYPKDTRSESDVKLRFERSDPSGPARLSGHVAVHRALYDRPFDVRREVLARVREFNPYTEAMPEFVEGTVLDIDVEAADGVAIQNDLIKMEARVDLHVAGTVRTPQLSGVVEGLEGGSVQFRDVTYEITQALLSFRGRPEINPLLDIRAETSVADYDVTLLITGPLDDFRFELSSTPPLPEADIVTLLLTGQTREGLAAGSGGLSEAEAARYLSRGITNEVSKTLRRGLGLDEVNIDPTLVEGEANPAARITIGKALSQRLYVVYSTLLGAGSENIYKLRYRLTDHVRLVGGRNDDGSLSADVQYGTNRYVGPGRPGGAAASKRPKVQSLEVAGNEVAGDKKVRKLLHLHAGSRYRHSTLLAGVDRVRDWYLKKGYPELEADYEIEDPAAPHVVVTLDEGREVQVDFQGVGHVAGLRKLVLESLRDTVFEDLAAETAAEAVRDRLRSKGWVDARVEPRAESATEGALHLAFDVDLGRRVRVERIEIRGATAFDSDRIFDQVLTAKTRWYDRSYLDVEVVTEDAASIRNLYLSNGYLEATVDQRIEYPDSPGRAVVTFEIDEGPRYTYSAVAYDGNAAFSDDRLAAVARVSAGGPYLDNELRDAEKNLLAFYDAKGYAEARVRADPAVDADARNVRVVFRIEEGPSYTVQAVEVHDRGMTDADVIRREILLEPGDPLSLEKLNQSRHELYRTGLFKSVGVSRVAGDEPGEQRIVFDLEEGPNFKTGYGLGVNSEEGVRVSANVGHQNLWGRRLYGGVGGHWSRTDRRFQLLARQPRFLGSRLDGLVSTFWEHLERDSFDVTSVGLSLQLTRRRSEYTFNWGYDIRDNDILQGGVRVPGGQAILDPVAGVDLRRQTDIRLANLVSSAGRDTRDDIFWPTTGSYTRAELRVYHKALFSEADIVRGFFQWSRYQGISSRLQWSSGIRLGAARPFGPTEEVPISERFFAGGEDTVRGFGRDEIAAVGFPKNELAAEGIVVTDPLGGNGLLIVNEELLYPIRPPLHSLLFLDAGNVYWELSDFDPTDLRWSAGIGLRVRTPAGPLRLEYGWKLDRKPEEDPGELHFSIGVAF